MTRAIRPGDRPGHAHHPEPPAPWGWVEVVILAQFLMPGVVFVPGMVGWLRTGSRVAGFAVPLMAWAFVLATGARPMGRRLWALPLLIFCGAWSLLEIAHPQTNSLTSGLAGAMLTIAVLSPAFWVSAARPLTVGRLRRLIECVFLANALSAGLGIAQFYRGDLFNPAVIPILITSAETADSRHFEDASGRRVLRPCGLGDTPGGAGVSGAYACVAGLALALAPGPWWKRGAALVGAMAGMGVIYLSFARVTLLMALCGTLALGGLLLARGEVRRLLALGALLAVVFGAGLTWAVGEGGEAIARRFTTLIEGRPTELYQANRGHNLTATFAEFLPANPLGAGMGRWGQPAQYFGRVWPPDDPRAATFVEIQWEAWALDGGAPLVLAYALAIVLALAQGVRIVLRSPDAEQAYWTAVVVAIGLMIVMVTFGAIPFSSAHGTVFWAAMAAAQAVDQQARGRRRPAPLAARGRSAAR